MEIVQVSATTENQKPEKRKRGRPRKYIADSAVNLPNTSSNSEVMMPEQPTSWEETPVHDWQLELDGDANLMNSESSESNDVLGEQPEITPQKSSVEQESASQNDENVPLSNHPKATKLPTTIHIIDGEKGGAGKSFVCRAFIEYCASINHEVAIIDADTSNQDIANIYPTVKFAFFSDDEKQAKEADKIFDLAFEKSVIVNLPAQVYSKVTDWINNNNLIDLGKEHSITFIKWFICTGGVDSVNFFIQSLDDLGDQMTHIFVRNLGLCDDWKYIAEMPEFQNAATKHNFIVMDFPKFPFWERNMVDRLGVTFSEAIAHPELKVISKQRVKNFLKEAYAAFAETGLIR
jgi:hypothetical protein